MPALLATSASEGIQILTSTPSILLNLHTNIFAIRSALERLDCITITSHPASAIIHIQVRPPSAFSLSPNAIPRGVGKPSNPSSVIPREPPSFDIEAEERLLQDVVDEALAGGVLLTRAKRLRGQEIVEPRPSIRIAASAALSKKDTEKAVGVVKAALVKVLGRRR